LFILVEFQKKGKMMKFTMSDLAIDKSSRFIGEDSLTSDQYFEESFVNQTSATSPTQRGDNFSTSQGGISIDDEKSKQIRCIRTIMVLVLIGSTYLASFIAYQVTLRGEEWQFETTHDDNSDKIMHAFEINLRDTIGALDNLALSTSTLVSTLDQTWPSVVTPDFELRGSSTRQMARSVHVSLLPLVNAEKRLQWEQFSIDNAAWVEEGASAGDGTDISRVIYPQSETNETYLPVWQSTPVEAHLVNFDLLSHRSFGQDLVEAIESKNVVIGRVTDVSKKNDPFNFLYQEVEIDEHHAELKSNQNTGKYGNPLSMVFFPVVDDSQKVVGVISGAIYWSDLLRRSLPSSAKPMDVILQNRCGQTFSFEIDGEDTNFIGEGDLHGGIFDDYEHSIQWDELDGVISTVSGVKINFGYCPYSISIYPTREMHTYYLSNQPLIYSLMIVTALIFTSFVFYAYDRIMIIAQKKIADKERKARAVVNSLFPANVQDRLFNEKREAPRTNTRFFKQDFEENSGKPKSRPIADLFPHATVLFADIAGFTAWCSSREPEQVFTLLESLYGEFDALARKLKVFKVETIGDCYVAVTGLPDPQEDHAKIMARFAFACIEKTSLVTATLESRLGPDTADLALRVGLNSGPVTAGVLRGEKSRFQLFGDAVNTASRIESTGSPNKIHCSETTAMLLIKAGRSDWITKREDLVDAKGKGQMQTYWITPGVPSTCASSSVSSVTLKKHTEGLRGISQDSSQKNASKPKQVRQKERLINWNVDLLCKLLRQVVASRENATQGFTCPVQTLSNPVLEVTAAVEMPELNACAVARIQNADAIKLPPIIVSQMHDLVTTLASMYEDNPFHNFDHAAHVSLSALKLLNRITDQRHFGLEASSNDQLAVELHGLTYGITSDPLLQLAVVFSAMIHDVGHSGVSNPQLIEESSDLAEKYNNKSISEQNSIDIAWGLLMESKYKELRAGLFAIEGDCARFRSLVVNAVIATDIFDRELTGFREQRWQRAFQEDNQDQDSKSVSNLRATIVMEHLIQASDVAHTMQHWLVYIKWNEKLFQEMYLAYKSGRGKEDPSEGWHNGELWFFDNYIIPLAGKLRQCGVFGVSSDEFLDYASANRKEWELKGERLVKEWLSKY
jgi:class 3 adenylate cyclase